MDSKTFQEQLNDLLDHMEEEYGIEHSEHARKVGRMVAHPDIDIYSLDGKPEMNEELYAYLAHRHGFPIYGRVQGKAYEFGISGSIPGESVTVPKRNHTDVTDSDLIVLEDI